MGGELPEVVALEGRQPEHQRPPRPELRFQPTLKGKGSHWRALSGGGTWSALHLGGSLWLLGGWGKKWKQENQLELFGQVQVKDHSGLDQMVQRR